MTRKEKSKDLLTVTAGLIGLLSATVPAMWGCMLLTEPLWTLVLDTGPWAGYALGAALGFIMPSAFMGIGFSLGRPDEAKKPGKRDRRLRRVAQWCGAVACLVIMFSAYSLVHPLCETVFEDSDPHSLAVRLNQAFPHGVLAMLAGGAVPIVILLAMNWRNISFGESKEKSPE